MWWRQNVSVWSGLVWSSAHPSHHPCDATASRYDFWGSVSFFPFSTRCSFYFSVVFNDTSVSKTLRRNRRITELLRFLAPRRCFLRRRWVIQWWLFYMRLPTVWERSQSYLLRIEDKFLFPEDTSLVWVRNMFDWCLRRRLRLQMMTNKIWRFLNIYWCCGQYFAR